MNINYTTHLNWGCNKYREPVFVLLLISHAYLFPCENSSTNEKAEVENRAEGKMENANDKA